MGRAPILAADGKALIVAMDHARAYGAIEGLEDPGAVIEASVEGGADAVMTTFGVAKRYNEQLAGRIPTVIRLDGGPSVFREDWLAYTEWSLLHSVDVGAAETPPRGAVQQITQRVLAGPRDGGGGLGAERHDVGHTGHPA